MDLIISGTVNMADGKKIVVEPGGRLIVYGKLTNQCGRMWQGIEVSGGLDYVLHFAGLPAAVATERTSWSTIKALFE